MLHLGGFVRFALKNILSVLGSASAKKLVVVESKNMEIMQQLIRKENLQQKYGGTAPDIIFGEDNIFPPLVPTDVYIKEGEELNIVTPQIYKEMCLESKPFKPFFISEEYIKLWENEEKEKLLKEKQKLKIKPSNDNIGFCLNDFLIEFENTKTKKIKNNFKYKKYEPKKIDLNSIKNFFDKMKSKNSNTIK